MRAWEKTAVFYHIYPLSFKDSNNDGVGDLFGIIQKLGYLKNLGIGAIWISPVNNSPMADFGYDVSDYCSIDPIFGNLKIFKKLIDLAHAMGIKIIVDFVPNHTSICHPWFIESRSSKENPKRGYYIWKNPKKDGSPPNNWVSVFGGSAWELDKTTNQYYLHSFLKEQPDLNWRNPKIFWEMGKILKFWVNFGVDGFRVDAASHIIKDEKFRDNPKNPNFKRGVTDPYLQFLPKFTQGQPENLKILKKFCNILSRFKDLFMITEAYSDISNMRKFYEATNCSSCTTFNFNFLSLDWNAQTYKNFVDSYDHSLSNKSLPNYVLSNHDRPRVASRIGTKKSRVAAILLLTLRGVPFIYYGDEIGMENVPIPPDKVLDPWEKNVPHLGFGRDPERTPMQWDAGSHAGFSKHQPWLPIATDYKKYNVRDESKDQKSMLSLYKKLINLRNNSEVLTFGSYKSLNIKNENIFCFIRKSKKKAVLVVLNFSDQKTDVSIPGFEKTRVLVNTHLDRKIGSLVDLNKLVLRENEGYVFAV